jgi:hypothetical protein
VGTYYYAVNLTVGVTGPGVLVSNVLLDARSSFAYIQNCPNGPGSACIVANPTTAACDPTEQVRKPMTSSDHQRF